MIIRHQTSLLRDSDCLTYRASIYLSICLTFALFTSSLPCNCCCLVSAFAHPSPTYLPFELFLNTLVLVVSCFCRLRLLHSQSVSQSVGQSVSRSVSSKQNCLENVRDSCREEQPLLPGDDGWLSGWRRSFCSPRERESGTHRSIEEGLGTLLRSLLFTVAWLRKVIPKHTVPILFTSQQ